MTSAPCPPVSALMRSFKSSLRVVDALVGAVLAADRELLGRRRRRDHLARPSPSRARPPRGRRRPPRPSTSNVSPGFKRGAVLERVVRRAVGEEKRRGGVERHRVRDRHDSCARRSRSPRRSRRIPARRARDRRPSGWSPWRRPARTTPDTSPPGENGSGGLNWYLFSMISRSGKLTPHALTASST